MHASLQTMSNPSPRPSPAHVLAVYAEPLLRGRRVALIAHGGEGMAELLQELGARLIYVYDPDEPGVRKPSEGVTVASFRGSDLGVRDGAFDVALVSDLGRLGDPEATLALVRRLIGPQGVAVVSCRNREVTEGWLASTPTPAGPSYGEFFDFCALQFSEVRMIGVAPFAGYAVAEFAPEREPAITFDPALVPAAEPPEWYVAVASQHPISALDPYEIVQIPRRAIASASLERSTAEGDDGRLASLQTEIGHVERELHEAEARAGNETLRAERLTNDVRSAQEEARKLREKLALQTKELEEERRGRKKVETDLAALTPEASTWRTRVLALEAELIEARTQLATPRVPPADLTKVARERDRAQADLQQEQRAHEETRRAAAQLEARLVERERQLEGALAKARGTEARVAELVRAASASEPMRGEIERLRGEVALALEVQARDVEELEGGLRACGEELRAARVELARRERMIRELVAELEDRRPFGELEVAPPPVELVDAGREQLELARSELAALVEEVRRRERSLAELRAEQQRIARDLEAERARNAELARDAARREAALQTASWRIVELERLGAEPAASTELEAPEGAGVRARVEDELDALRQALVAAQERCAKLERAASAGGSDPELARVLARLDEREALIAQLSAELAARGVGGGGLPG